MFVIMTPVEMLGKLTKPFALADPFVREHDGGPHRRARAHRPDLHVQELGVAGAVHHGGAIMMLELFVALLQAYIFTLLSSVFIGLIGEGAALQKRERGTD